MHFHRAICTELPDNFPLGAFAFLPHVSYISLAPMDGIQSLICKVLAFLSNPKKTWGPLSLNIASGAIQWTKSIGGQICNLCKWDQLAPDNWYINTLIVCGTSPSRAKRERKKEILTSPVSPHEQSWSRGENFCVSMTTDGFKGFKGPRDVSGSPRHSLNCATHPNPSLLTQLVPVCIQYNVYYTGSPLTVQKMTNTQNLFDWGG